MGIFYRLCGTDDPRAHDFKDYFLAHQPKQVRTSVVHGDYFYTLLV